MYASAYDDTSMYTVRTSPGKAASLNSRILTNIYLSKCQDLTISRSF